MISQHIYFSVMLAHKESQMEAARQATRHSPGQTTKQLEKSVSWSGRERLRCLWYRLRLTVAEMNYATRRTVELRAPWISDKRASRSRNELR